VKDTQVKDTQVEEPSAELETKFYDDKGRLIVEIISIVDGKIEKYFYTYYSTNQLHKKTRYINDIKNGQEEIYYKNGNLLCEVNYKNNLYHGESIEYYKDESLKTIQCFVDGKLDGRTVSYHNNGNMHREEIYKNGKKNGVCNSYYKNGKLEYTVYMRNDKLRGFARCYYENGNKKILSKYNKYDQISYIKTFTIDGKIKKDMRRGSGIDNSYFSSGELSSQINHFNGRKVKEIHYYKNGNLAKEIFYEDTKPSYGYNYTKDGKKIRITTPFN